MTVTSRAEARQSLDGERATVEAPARLSGAEAILETTARVAYESGMAEPRGGWCYTDTATNVTVAVIGPDVSMTALVAMVLESLNKMGSAHRV